MKKGKGMVERRRESRKERKKKRKGSKEEINGKENKIFFFVSRKSLEIRGYSYFIKYY